MLHKRVCAISLLGHSSQHVYRALLSLYGITLAGYLTNTRACSSSGLPYGVLKVSNLHLLLRTCDGETALNTEDEVLQCPLLLLLLRSMRPVYFFCPRLRFLRTAMGTEMGPKGLGRAQLSRELGIEFLVVLIYAPDSASLIQLL